MRAVVTAIDRYREQGRIFSDSDRRDTRAAGDDEDE
jgi:hypothetical protein